MSAGPVRVLVCNRGDTASVNIRDRLLEAGDWELTGARFRGAVVWGQSEAILVEVEGPTVHDEGLENDLRATALPIRDIWFLSRHRAESGHPSLTVHPIGNPGPIAQLGGRPATFSPASARDMGALLRRLKHHRDAYALPHSVTYEATHHGPFTSIPSLFLEIGSDDAWYSHRESARAVAAAVTDVLRGDGRSRGPVLVGVGGGHYVPRHTDVALAAEADFGHLLAAHAVEAALAAGDAQLLARAAAATPECSGVHLHKKGLKGPVRAAVLEQCAAAGIPVWTRPGQADGPDS